MTETRGIALAVYTDAPMPVLLAPGQAGKILHNLLAHALAHTPVSGTVHAKVSIEHRDVVCEIFHDTILDDTDRDSLIEPFHRTADIQQKRQRRIGPGPSPGKSIAESHGGTIDVHSSADPPPPSPSGYPASSDGTRKSAPVMKYQEKEQPRL